MENRIRKKVNTYLNDFKDDIMKTVTSKQSDVDILNFISSYPRLSLEEDDFSKRKRVKNHVPQYDRCIAKRADCQQCTRRKKEGTFYCGTHMKGTPHGEINKDTIHQKRKVELVIKYDKGIPHYTDDKGVIYCAEDVLNLAAK
tara:strand:- start:107 stop:535 length:429 start_codon:yes stop_codon:yes gene_type:complete